MKKSDRVKGFIMGRAEKRADSRVRTYLSKNDLHLAGVDDFDAAMSAICSAMMQMYSDAMCDALDIAEGRPLAEVVAGDR